MEVILENILSRKNLLLARKQVVSNKGAAGIDGMSVEELGEYLINNWKEIRYKIEQGILLYLSSLLFNEPP